MRRALILMAVCLAPPAFAQFSLYVVNGNVETPAPASLDLGQVYPTESAVALFRIRNTSNAPAPLNLLAVNGAGFLLSGAPPLPYGLNPQQSVDFTAVFQAGSPGTYSASLDTEGASVLLTAAVLPRLTYQVIMAAGPQTLGAAPVDFGSVQAGNSVTLHFTVTNLTGLVLAAPGIAVQGAAFSIPGQTPAGVIFQPGDNTGFDVLFQPAAVGPATGTLTIGDRNYTLTGTGLPLPLPAPGLAISLPQAQSNQQGTVAVIFSAPAQTASSGTLTLAFQPLAPGATDPSIQLGVAGGSLAFSFAAGDTQANFNGLEAVNFQTGTTAGSLTFTAAIGGVSAQQGIVIPAAPVGILSASGRRSSGSIQLSVAAFDNTRTAGRVTYLFYDSGGNLLAPAMTVDSTSGFTAYFASSTEGGNFLLDATFPVSGNASGIAAFEVQMANSAGTATTGRVKF